MSGISNSKDPPPADDAGSPPADEPLDLSADMAIDPGSVAAARERAGFISTPTRQTRALAEAVVASILERLKTEADARNGMLTADDLEELRGELEKKADALQQVFQVSFEEYVRARERAGWQRARRYPFDRIIVNRVSHLFVEDTGQPLAGDAVSRRILPAFFIALNMMLGHDRVESYQQLCTGIIDRLKDSLGEAFTWNDAYNDDEARDVALDAQILIALHFKDMQKRIGWFRNLINNHLPPPDPDDLAGGPSDGLDNTAAQAAEYWEITDAGLVRFLVSLFSELALALESLEGQEAIVAEYGAETCALLGRIIKQLGGLDEAAKS